MTTQQKNFLHPVFVIAGLLLVLGINANSIREHRNLRSETVATENEFIQQLRHQLQKIAESHPEERVYVVTDKTLYRRGETVWMGGFVREGSRLNAALKSQVLNIEITNPAGAVARKFSSISLNGMCKADFNIEQDWPGGIYKIKAFTNWMKNDSAYFEKEITVQEVMLPRIKMKLEFERESYKAGEEVSALLSVETNENLPLSNADFRYSVSVSGTELLQKTSTTGNNGKTHVRFVLPNKLKTSDAFLNVMLDYEGQTESIGRMIPIQINAVSLQLFPEGGDLVENIQSKVAFRAANERGKPTDVFGVVLDKSGKEVTTFRSYAKGMGHFMITPMPNETYVVKVTSVSGHKGVTLPGALPQGFVLSCGANINQQLPIAIQSTIETKSSVVITQRGQMVWATELALKKGMNTLQVPTHGMQAGVVAVTLFDNNGLERCERLCFVNTDKQLSISLKTDKEKYLPREKVKLSVQTTDADGLPVSAQLALSVVNDQLVSYANDKQNTLLSQLLLQYDIHEKISEPAYYFDANEAKAPVALDYLLMTAGWRRFTWKEIKNNQVPHFGIDAERARVSGVVLDAYSHQPLNQVFVKAKGSRLTAKTDEKGFFCIQDIDITNYSSLEFSKEGFPAKEVALHEIGNIGNIFMDNNRQLEFMNKRLAFQGLALEDNIAEIPMAAGEAEVVAEKRLERKMGAPPQKMNPAFAKPVKPAIPNKDKQIMQKEVVRLANPKFDLEDEMPEEQNENNPKDAPRFTRAREFPKPVYEEYENGNKRSDFRSTIYFDGMLETDKSGRKSVEFVTSDELTSFRIVAEGIGNNGFPGRSEAVIFSQLPFTLSAKVPSVVILKDLVSIPVTLKNNTNVNISGNLSLRLPNGFALKSNSDFAHSIPANSALTFNYVYEVGGSAMQDTMFISFEGGSFSDKVALPLRTEPRGFPIQMAFSEKALMAEHRVQVTNAVEGSVSVSLTAFPSVVSDLMKGVESILNEPNGCFEQTSMSSYPNVMVLDYLRTTEQNDPKIISRAEELLEKGYKRLVSFETKEKGYEWFGGSPGHEALTAYGLMQFNDMKHVYASVDNAMVKRTADWLLSRRDGNGGFLRNSRALDQFGAADADITDAYIVYALAEAGFAPAIQAEIAHNGKRAFADKDPYTLALSAIAYLKNNQRAEAEKLINLLVEKQQPDGSWKARKHSITRSGGSGLTIETTSLALMALMNWEEGLHGEINKGIEFLVKNKNALNGYGSTQATILALKALTHYAKQSKKAGEDGTLLVLADGRKVAEVAYDKNQSDPIVINNLQQHLQGKSTTFTVKFLGVKNAMPHTLSVQYHSDLPPSSEECVVDIRTHFSSEKVKQGETIRMNIVLKNLRNQGQPSTMAVVGLPAGLSVSPHQLKELTEKQAFDYYEIRNNKLFLYYRQLKPSEEKSIALDLKAELPGTYQAPASSAYLYYTAEHKKWVALPSITVMK